MYLPPVEFHRTTTLGEAAELLERFGTAARLLAGGTDLLVDLKAGRVTTEHVISISSVPELKGITWDSGTLRIGAMTTITDLAESPPVRDNFAPILDATRRMAVQQIRNVATVGGNLASAVPCADLPPILTVLDASVELWSVGQTRTLALADFFAGPRQTALRKDEVLKALEEIKQSHAPITIDITPEEPDNSANRGKARKRLVEDNERGDIEELPEIDDDEAGDVGDAGGS